MFSVSVIVPNYNHAKYLKKRIESILNQTYQDFELIILDDCSNDKSKQIIEEYRNNPKVSKIIYNLINSRNISAQWAKGIENSQGKYIWLAESDDYADKRFLEEQIEIISRNDGCSLVYCNSIIVDENDEIIGSMEKWKNELFKTDKWNYGYSNNGKEELFNYLIHACTINNLSSCVFRKSAFIEVLDRVNSSKYAMDELLYMLLLYHNDISYNKNKLNFYRKHAENASRSNSIYGRDFIDRLFNRLAFYRSENLTNKEKRLLFKKIVKEYRGILASIRLKNFRFKDFIIVHIVMRNPLFIFRIFISAVFNRIAQPYGINNDNPLNDQI